MATQEQIDRVLCAVFRRGVATHGFKHADSHVRVGGLYIMAGIGMNDIGHVLTKAYRSGYLAKTKQSTPTSTITEKGWQRLAFLLSSAMLRKEAGSIPLTDQDRFFVEGMNAEMYAEIIKRYAPPEPEFDPAKWGLPPQGHRSVHESVNRPSLRVTRDMTDEEREAIFARRALDPEQVDLAAKALAGMFASTAKITVEDVKKHLSPVEIIKADHQTMTSGPTETFYIRELKRRKSAAGEYEPRTLADIAGLEPKPYAGAQRSGIGKIMEGLELTSISDIARRAGYSPDTTLGKVWADMETAEKASHIGANAPAREWYSGSTYYVIRYIGDFEGRPVHAHFAVESDYDADDVENFKTCVDQEIMPRFARDDWGRVIDDLPTVDYIDARLNQEAAGEFITVAKAALVAREACFRVMHSKVTYEVRTKHDIDVREAVREWRERNPDKKPWWKRLFGKD